jgi:hypothetical protein
LGAAVHTSEQSGAAVFTGEGRCSPASSVGSGGATLVVGAFQGDDLPIFFFNFFINCLKWNFLFFL